MAPGCAGCVFVETVKLRIALLPQELLARTDINPPVMVGVAVIKFVIEVPTQPEGSVQV